MKFEFVKSDFTWLMPELSSEDRTKQIAIYCNEVLQNHIASLPVVYGIPGVGGLTFSDSTGRQNRAPHNPDTHKAVLFDLEPILETQCQHEPIRIDASELFGGIGNVKIFGFKPVCGFCGKKLSAKWEVAE